MAKTAKTPARSRKKTRGEADPALATGTPPPAPRPPGPAALVIGAGAPHSPLMAGALCAIHNGGKTFDLIYTSGGGALIGLLFIAPKDKEPQEALRSILDLGVDDAIYRFVPIGYKTFFKPRFKPGPFTELLHRCGEFWKIHAFPEKTPPSLPTRLADTPPGEILNLLDERLNRPLARLRRLSNDWIDLWVSVLTPTPLNPFSKGLCEPFPLVDKMVDFGRLKDKKKFPGRFYMNAYNITAHEMEMFDRDKDDIEAEHLRAALAFPFIYPPVKIKGKLYSEGADHDPLNFGKLADLVANHKVATIVLIDVLGSLEECLIREPRNLWDAYGISIMTPVVELAKKNREKFERDVGAPTHVPEVKKESLRLRHFTGSHQQLRFEYLHLKFEIRKELWPRITDWSYSNMEELWKIGLKAGEEFLDAHRDRLPQRS